MTLYGPDISGWQRDLNPSAIPGDFIIVKATGGTGFVSDVCDRQVQATLKAGKRLGVYHFAREAGYRGTARQEAEHFLKHTAGYRGKAIPILDWEGDNVGDVAWAKEWMDIVRAAWGVKPLIYMNLAALQGADWGPVVKADYGLWLAAYPNMNRINGYTVPGPWFKTGAWKSAAMWQFTSTGRLPGYGADLDLNVFYGDAKAWDAYVGASKPTTAPKPPAPAPAPKPPVKPAPKPSTVTVQPGDTLSAVAARVGTTWQELARINSLSNPDLVYPGQALKVTGAAAGSRPRTYTVAPGDSLSTIASRYGTTWQVLARLNHLANADYIQAGQTLTLP